MMQMLLGAGGASGVPVSDLFSTDLYSNPSTAPNPRTITNGIDFLNEGGLLWVRNRDWERGHVLYNTANSATSSTSSHCLTANNEEPLKDMGAIATVTWNNNGWSVPSGDGDINGNNFGNYVAWSFRKAEKFFDIITYDGDGTDGRAINHNLGCVPGMILVKKTDGSDQYWAAYHVAAGATHYMKLNDGMAAYDHTNFWDDTTPTSTQFTVGGTTSVNHNEGKFTAFLFAKDEDNIKCGTTSSISGYNTETIQLGWKPQFLLVKPVTNSGNWLMADSERGLYTSVSSTAKALYPNTNDDEETVYDSVAVHDNGFIIKDYTGSTGTYAYMAIKEE